MAFLTTNRSPSETVCGSVRLPRWLLLGVVGVMLAACLVRLAAVSTAAEPEVNGAQPTPALGEAERQKTERLANDLYQGDFAARQRATRELLAQGNAAIDTALVAALSADAEVRRRGEYLLTRFTLGNSRETRQQIREGLVQLGAKRPESASQVKLIGKQLQSISIKAAKLEIERHGGTVRDARDVDDSDAGPFTVSIGKTWRGDEKALATLVDLEEIYSLTFTESSLSDRGMQEIAKLPSLTMLILNRTRVTDTGMAMLPASLNLKLLSMAYLPITDNGIKNLAAFPDLMILDLSGSRITNEGLPHLKKFSKLQRLWLKQTDITAAGMPHLVDLEQLTELSLEQTKVTGPQLASLKVIPTLNTLKLDLDSTPITDEQLASLKHIPNLQELSLSRTKLTDQAVVHLKELKMLRTLGLHATKITEAGKKQLQKALPECNIAM